MQRVLVPYDQSEQATRALDHALSTFDSATIVVLHVVQPFADHTGAGGYEATRVPQQLATAREMLDSLRAEQDEPERVETAVRYGRPAHVIVRYVETEGIDHVVLGNRGRDGATRILLGSVAEATARRSSAPVTVARESDTAETVEDVLVAFDGSTRARRALAHALDRFPEASFTVLYVVYPPTEQTREGKSGFEVLESWADERDDHAASVLSVAEELAADRGRTIETRTASGKPAATIVEHADEADHVVVGSAGRDGVSRLLLGSVAETVLRRSPVTVTVVK